jgi:hypothetical protein
MIVDKPEKKVIIDVADNKDGACEGGEPETIG